MRLRLMLLAGLCAVFGFPAADAGARSVGGPAAVLRPGGEALLLVPRGDARTPTALVALRRPAGGQSVASTTVVVPDSADSYLGVVASASNARGDLAAIVRHGVRAVLVRAPAGSDDISATDVGTSFQGGIAVGADGAVRLLTVESGQVLARSGAITGSLGDPQVLARVRNLPDLAVAIDQRGTATAAFQRASGGAITVVASRAREGGRFAAPVVLDRGPNAQAPVVVAGGSRTAVAWANLTARNGPRVAFAGPTGGFGRAVAPAAPLVRLRGEARRFQLGAGFPRLAASPAGAILFAYPYGLTQAVHATVAAPGARTFARPVVVSALGAGGTATPVFLADGTPLLVTATGRAIVASDGPLAYHADARAARPQRDAHPGRLTRAGTGEHDGPLLGGVRHHGRGADHHR